MARTVVARRKEAPAAPPAGAVAAARLDYSACYRVCFTPARGQRRTLDVCASLDEALEAYVARCRQAAEWDATGEVDVVAPGGASLLDAAVTIAGGRLVLAEGCR